MMKLFQKTSMKKWGYVIASFIMLTFMLWGGQTYLLGERKSNYTYAGKIFGHKVSFEEYQKNLQQVEAMARLQYGENFRKIQEMLNLDNQAWDRIILLDEARRRRISIADDAVIDGVEKITRIKIDNPMVRQNYENFLRRELGLLPRVFEEGVRDSLKIAEIYEKETAKDTVADKDVELAYRQKNEKVQVSYAIFPTEDLKKQVPFDESKAQQYFEDHKDDFLMPPTVDVEYIQIDAPKPLSGATPTEKNPMNTEAPTPLSEEASEAAWQKTDAIYSKIVEGKGFATVAKENNLTVQTSGPFSMEQPTLKPGWTFPLIQRIFQANAGDVLEPIGTPAGFQILRIKSKKDAYVPEYKEIKDKVKDRWTEIEAKKLSRQKAEDARKKVVGEFEKFKNPDFVSIAKGLNLTLAQTPAFSRGEYIEGLGINKELQDAAFNLTTTNPMSEVIETMKGYCFLHLDSVVAADMKDFEKEKEKLKEALLSEKKAATFNNFLNQLRIQANLDDNIAKIKAQQKKAR